MYKRWGKRVLDILVSLIALVPAALIVGVCTLVIWLEDHHSPFYVTERVGRGGKRFGMIKLRTMKPDSPDTRNQDGTTFSSADDPRMTRAGKPLREYSLDELPQILNVLAGQMSLVGPRPDLPDQQAGFSPEQLRKNLVRPGITGYNQAYFRVSVSMRQKIIHDVYYVDHMSLGFDLRIMLKTVGSVLRAKDVYTPRSGGA